MKEDLKLVRKKLKEARQLPEHTTVLYNHKQDILRHWLFEQHMLKSSISWDEEYYKRMGVRVV